MQEQVVERLFPRTYRFTDHATSWEQRAVALQIWGGPYSALSGSSAARIWNLLDASDLELTTTTSVRRPTADVVIHRVRDWRLNEVVRRGPFVVTHPCRTLVDLAASLPEEELETALNIATHRRLVTSERLARYLQAAPRGLKGLAALNRMMERRNLNRRVPVNHFETKLLRLLRKHRMPLPEPQFPVRRPGERVVFIDFGYPEAMVAIEADGYDAHGDYRAWIYDRARRNDLEALGWRVVQITYRQLCDAPEEVIWLVKQMLQPPMFVA